MQIIQKGIYSANLNPTKESEQSGRRPVVIISGSSMNEHMRVVIVCPLSSSVKKYPGCVFVGKNKINNLKTDSEILTFQIRTLSQSRLSKKIGMITDKQLMQIMAGFSDIVQY